LPLVGGRIGSHYELTPPVVPVRTFFCRSRTRYRLAVAGKNPLNFVNNFASLSVELLDELKDATEPAVAALSEEKRAEVDETMELLTGNLEKIAEHGRRADNIVVRQWLLCGEQAGACKW
jgi:hypothetical protein